MVVVVGVVVVGVVVVGVVVVGVVVVGVVVVGVAGKVRMHFVPDRRPDEHEYDVVELRPRTRTRVHLLPDSDHPDEHDHDAPAEPVLVSMHRRPLRVPDEHEYDVVELRPRTRTRVHLLPDSDHPDEHEYVGLALRVL